jgi:hypothetical protein
MTDAPRPSLRAFRRLSGKDSPRVVAPAAASPPIDRFRQFGCLGNSEAAKCPCQPRLRESGRRPGLLRQSPPDVPVRKQRRKRYRISEPNACRPSLRRPCHVLRSSRSQVARTRGIVRTDEERSHRLLSVNEYFVSLRCSFSGNAEIIEPAPMFARTTISGRADVATVPDAPALRTGSDRVLGGNMDRIRWRQRLARTPSELDLRIEPDSKCAHAASFGVAALRHLAEIRAEFDDRRGEA